MIKNTETVTVEIAEIDEEVLSFFTNMEHVYEAKLNEGQLKIRFSGGKHNLLHVLDYLKQKEIPFGRVYSELPTLNDVFLEITGKQLRD